MKTRPSFAFAIACIGIIFAVSAPNAQAFDVAVVGALSFPSVSIDPTPTAQTLSGTATFGFGAQAQTALVPFLLDLQVGALYMPRTINGTAASSTSGQTFKSLEIPVMVRFVGLPLVSVGAGGYYSHTVGAVNSTTTPTSGIPTSSTDSYDALNLSTSDVGLVGSVDFKYPLLPTISAIADARYLLGLSNVDATSVTTRKARSFEILVGINFGI